jgi:hypothetical protein
MRRQLCGHLRQQPPLLQHPVDQILVYVGEAQLGHPGDDPLLGVAAPLGCQPLPTVGQPHPQPRQGRLHLPVAYPELRRDPGDAVAGVAAGLQVCAQILEPQYSSAVVQAPIAATVHSKAALDDQPTRRFCWWWVAHAIPVPPGTTTGNPLTSAFHRNPPSQRNDDGQDMLTGVTLDNSGARSEQDVSLAKGTIAPRRCRPAATDGSTRTAWTRTPAPQTNASHGCEE